MSFKFESAVEGTYRLEIKRGATGETEVHEFKNLITNAGMDRFATQGVGPWLLAVSIGSGSTTPANTDTALASYVASVATTNANGVWNTADGGYMSVVYTGTFAQGAVVGNMTEVGGAAATGSSSPLFTRALIKDGSGNPTVLTLTSIDQLTMTYTLRVYPSAVDSVATLTINGVSTTVTIRRANNTSLVNVSAVGNPYFPPNSNASSGASSAALPALDVTATSELGSSNNGNGNVPYTSGTYTARSIITYPITSGNGNIASMVFNTLGQGRYNVGFSPAVTKGNTQTFTFTFDMTWARK